MLVSLEGLDGSGKTTVWERLAEREAYTFTHEPTDSWYGDAVRKSIDTDGADPLAELFLFTADHADHLSRVVKPALDRGEVVITDRYSDSRYAYQGAAIEGLVPDPVAYVQEIHQPFTRPPDLTIYFEVDPATGVERSGATNKLEQQAFLESVEANYERLIDAEPDRFVRVNAEQPLDAVFEAVASIIERETAGQAD
ncbi:MAG: dTMP kinase [Halobacteriota archaeon]